MKNRTYTTTLELGDLGEVDCVVSYDYYPGSPGRYSGPPEDCYPAEDPEVDVTDVVFQGLVLSPHRLAELLKQLQNDAALKAKILEHEEEERMNALEARVEEDFWCRASS